MKLIIIKLENIIIDSKSGYSGAGRGVHKKYKDKNLYESLSAYGVGFHRHNSEIDQMLRKFTKKKFQFSFTPHLSPMFRGILSTIYLDLEKNISQSKVLHTLVNFYKNYGIDMSKETISSVVIPQRRGPRIRLTDLSGNNILNFLLNPNNFNNSVNLVNETLNSQLNQQQQNETNNSNDSDDSDDSDDSIPELESDHDIPELESDDDNMPELEELPNSNSNVETLTYPSGIQIPLDGYWNANSFLENFLNIMN